MQLPNYKNVRFLTTETITLLQRVDKYTNVKALRPEKSLLNLLPLNIRVVNNSNVHQPESLYIFSNVILPSKSNGFNEVESNGKNN